MKKRMGNETDQMEPLVSVIVPCFNGERFVMQAVNSVLSQTYEHLEVIVVDDGSTDNSAALLTEACHRDIRLRYLRQHNQGVASARNYGYSESKGAFIAFLDCDDIWQPDNISTKVDKLLSGDFGLVHSDGQIIDENSQATGGVMTGREGYILDKLLAWEGTSIPGPSSVLIPRKALDEIGTFDITLSTSADQDLFFRIAARFPIGRVARTTWSYRIHSGNMHKNIGRMEHDVLRVYNKARQAGVFRSTMFRRECFATMYLVLAASWAGDGQNPVRGSLFLVKALATHPGAWRKVIKKITSRD